MSTPTTPEVRGIGPGTPCTLIDRRKIRSACPVVNVTGTGRQTVRAALEGRGQLDEGRGPESRQLDPFFAWSEASFESAVTWVGFVPDEPATRNDLGRIGTARNRQIL
jgi:hypothetical protein